MCDCLRFFASTLCSGARKSTTSMGTTWHQTQKILFQKVSVGFGSPTKNLKIKKYFWICVGRKLNPARDTLGCSMNGKGVLWRLYILCKGDSMGHHTGITPHGAATTLTGPMRRTDRGSGPNEAVPLRPRGRGPGAEAQGPDKAIPMIFLYK